MAKLFFGFVLLLACSLTLVSCSSLANPDATAEIFSVELDLEHEFFVSYEAGMVPRIFWAVRNVDSSISHYEVALGTSAGGTDTVGWEDVGNAFSHDFGRAGEAFKANLRTNLGYYASVRAAHWDGGYSEAVSAGPFQVPVSVAPAIAVPPPTDPTPNALPMPTPTPAPVRETTPSDAPMPAPTRRPTPMPTPTPAPIVLSMTLAGDPTPTSAPTATWNAGDSSTGVSRYEVALGTSMGGTEVLPWKNVGPDTSYRIRDGVDGVQVALDAKQDYYLSLRAVNDDGIVIAVANSRAWFLDVPYAFNIEGFSSVTQDAPNSFWGIRHPDSRYSHWDDSFEAYVVGSAAIDLYGALAEKFITGSSQVKILQTESGLPRLEGVTRLGAGESNSSHADAVASMLYDCEVSDTRQSYYRGCQTNPRKYAMTSAELGKRLNDFLLTAQTAHDFENAIFGEMQAPQVWSMAHAHPTSVDREGPYEQDEVAGLRLGDWIFARFNILAISPQPGSYGGNENPTLSGNYYNSIVVGRKSFNYTYPAQSSIDNTVGPHSKPDIVVAASNLAEASSWSVPTLAAAGSAFLGLANADPLLNGATQMQTMKAIILAGAGKNHLCPEATVEADGFCNGLPAPSEQWRWSNSESAPLDPTYGVGLFNYRNSFDILRAGRSIGWAESKAVGWDSQELADGSGINYTFAVGQPNDAFSLALTWNRDISVDSEGNLSAHLADFMVELRDGSGRIVGRSDDLGNNIEHIYVPGGLSVGQAYTISVTLKSSDVPVRYGLAWQVKDSALQNNLWVGE